ncbi:F-box domain [Trinorchestia longiramus]|nr:F-box domain [Trinorchestia longiramus]
MNSVNYESALDISLPSGPQASHCNGLSEESIEVDNKGLLDLPYHLLCEIATLLDLEDVLSFGLTCKMTHKVVSDQHTWRRRLWYWGKTVNVCMAKNSFPHLKKATAVISDPLLLNLRTLYEALSPGGCLLRKSGPPVLDMANLLAKLDPTHANHPTFIHTIINVLYKFVGHRVEEPHSTQIGVNENRYVLFAQPETRAARSMLMTLMASRSNIIETVGLVEGSPGGIGSGVTVRYETVNERPPHVCGLSPSLAHQVSDSFYFNLLPLRRVYPRLLMKDSPQGELRYSEEVARVVRDAAGVVCVLDAECLCTATAPSSSTISIESHHLELVALKAMLRTFPTQKCPVVLIMMVRFCAPQQPPNPPSDGAAPEASSSAATSAAGNETGSANTICHKPYLLKSFMDPWHIPWAAFEVELPSLNGLNLALNWLVKRTNVHQTSYS